MEIYSSTNSRYLIAFQGQLAQASITMPKSATTTPIIKETSYTNLIHKWGIDNLFPNNIYNASKNNTIIPSTLQTKMELLVAGGWTYGIPEFNEDGEEILKFVKNTALENFLRYEINVSKYLQEAALDLYWHYMAFPQIVIDREKDKIVNIAIQDAQHCRLSRQDTHGNFPFTLVNANWDKFEGENSKYVQIFQNIDNYNNPVDDLRLFKREAVKFDDNRTASNTHYIYPISFTSSGTLGYSYPAWIAALESKWVALANAIATYKASLMENELSATYIIYVEEEYWQIKYPKWKNLKEEDQNKLRDELKQLINNLLSGVSNAGKTIQIPTLFDKHMKIERKFIKIEPIPKHIREGAYIEDSQEASSHLLYALGVPAALIGNTPGKGGLGAGSGSDIEAHFQLYQWRIRLHEEILLEPFNRLILPYNGFEGYKIALRKPKFQTKAQTNPSERM